MTQQAANARRNHPHGWGAAFSFLEVPMMDAMLSVNAASHWLRERGIRPCTRHSIYLAIARKRMRVAASAKRVVLIRRTELERYARELEGLDDATNQSEDRLSTQA
jgi:hypothetical protein